MALNTSPKLLAIPPELRNTIYHEVSMTVPIVMTTISCDTPEDISAAIRVDHSLPKVCRQLRQEAGPVIKAIAPLTAPKLIVRMDAFHFEKLSRLSDYLQSQAEHCKVDIAGAKSMRMVLKLGRETNESLMSIRRQLGVHLHNVDASVAASLFRYATLFKLTDVSCDFHLRSKDMATAEKRKTITHNQLAFSKLLFGQVDYLISSQGADMRAAIATCLYKQGLSQAYEALRAARARKSRDRQRERRASIRAGRSGVASGKSMTD